MYFLFAVAITACFIPGLLLRYVPFPTLLTVRQKGILALCYLLLAAVNVAAAYCYTKMNKVDMVFVKADMLAFGIAITVVNVLVIPGRFREHLFVYGVVTTCNYLIVSLPTLMTTGLLGVVTMQDYSVAAASYVVLVVACYFPIRKLLRGTVEPFLSLECGDYWGTIWFIPVALFLAMYIAFPGNLRENSFSEIIARLLIGSAMILMCRSIAADHQRFRDRQNMEDQLTDQKVHYAEMRAHVEDARKMRHDFKHYLAAVQHYIDTDDKSGLQDYCDDLTAMVNVDVQIPYTGNTAVDGVLYRYAKLDREHQIDFQYRGSFKPTNIADMDLCVLIGNALENALQGCKTVSEKRFISLTAEVKGEMFSVAVSNSFDGVVEEKGGVLLSRKRDHEPGVGMASMRTVCDSCNGSMQYQHDGSVFYLVILLPGK